MKNLFQKEDNVMTEHYSWCLLPTSSMVMTMKWEDCCWWYWNLCWIVFMSRTLSEERVKNNPIPCACRKMIPTSVFKSLQKWLRGSLRRGGGRREWGTTLRRSLCVYWNQEANSQSEWCKHDHISSTLFVIWMQIKYQLSPELRRPLLLPLLMASALAATRWAFIWTLARFISVVTLSLLLSLLFRIAVRNRVRVCP